MLDARAYANADLLRGLLPILDTFEMGLDAARAESQKSTVFQGLKMVQGMFGNYLRDFGVEEVPAEGQTFDPNLHEALSTEPSDTVPDHKVIRVLRRGYKLKDRLLRPANVVVSSGAPNSGADA
jgi:molecular chaperone GrpE